MINLTKEIINPVVENTYKIILVIPQMDSIIYTINVSSNDLIISTIKEELNDKGDLIFCLNSYISHLKYEYVNCFLITNLQILAPKLVNFYIRARDHFWSHILFIWIMHADCYFLHT